MISSDSHLKGPLGDGQTRRETGQEAAAALGIKLGRTSGAQRGLAAVGTEEQTDSQSISEAGCVGPADGISQGKSERRDQEGLPERRAKSSLLR